MEIGEKIRKIRTLKGISQDYLARKIGVSQNLICKIENNETKLSESRLKEIASILNVEVEEILNFDEKSIFNVNFTESSKNEGIAVVYQLIQSSFENERTLYERMIKLYQDEIESLKKRI